MKKWLKEWRLPMRSFYPLGIKPIFDDTKCGFLIWSHGNICYFIFNDVLQAINEDQPTSRTYSEYPEIAIKDAITTDSNVTFITKSGEVMYFESRKKIQTIPNVIGVKAICNVPSKIVLLRCVEEKKIFLEIYSDNTEEFQRLHEFDISFGPDHCQGRWDLSEFHVKAFEVTDSNRNFIKNGFKCDMAEGLVLVYSINNHLFAFWCENEGEDEIVPLNSFVTNVAEFWMSNNGEALFILLESGYIEIMYWAEETKLPTFSKVYLGTEVECYGYCDQLFTYSDGFDVIQLKLTYNEASKEYQAEKFTSELAGICSLTYMEKIKKIICVSENRLFYSMDIHTHVSDPVAEIVNRFIEVDQSFLSEVDSVEELLAEEMAIGKKLKADIEKEYKTFERLALTKNFKPSWNLFEVTVKLQSNCPEMNPTMVFPDRVFEYTSDTYFICLNMVPGEHAKCLATSLESWQFHILVTSHRNDKTMVNRVPMEPRMLNAPFQIVIVNQIEEYFTPPKITMKICTIADLGSDSLLLSMPLKVNSGDFCEMLRIVLEEPTYLQTGFGKLDVLGHPIKRRLLNYKMKLPKKFDIAKMFRETAGITGKETTLFVIFLGKYCKLEKDQDILKFEADDPGVMYVIKNFVAEKFDNPHTPEEMEAYSELMMNFQLDIEELQKGDPTEDEVLELYNKIRDVVN